MHMGDVFDLLKSKVGKLSKERFGKPTVVQELSIPKVLEGKNVLILAETGTGKTESVFLPILDKLVSTSHKSISLLYITPLRSLNRNLLDRILWWCNQLDLEVSVRHGDTTTYERSQQVENPPDVLISTPETLQSMIVGSRMREHLANIRYLVIDEVHELVPSKRGVQLSVGLERLKELIASSGHPKPQIIGLSATIGSPKEVAEFIGAEEIVDVAKTREAKIFVESPNTTAADVKTGKSVNLLPETTARLRLISDLIKNKESVIIFTNTRESAEVLSSRMKILGSSLETHHSSLSKDVRIDVERGFKEKEIQALVATSSLELGIDIGSIDFIVQYMSPRQVTKLLQRLGRSGHSVSKKSDGVIVASDTDDCFESTAIAKLALEHKIEPTKIYTQSLDVLAHQIIGLTLEYYEIEIKKAYEIIKRAYPFRDLSEIEFLDVCDFLNRLWLVWPSYEKAEFLKNLNSKKDENEEEEDEKAETEINKDGGPKPAKVFDLNDKIRRRKRSWEYYYGNLSTIPDTKTFNVVDIINNKRIGTLNEGFVAMHGTPGSYFICKGQAWKVVDVEGDKLIVEPTSNLEAAIPAWEGELIPVEYMVAEKIGKMRGEIESLLKKGKPEVLKHLQTEYPISKEVAEKLYKIIKEQKEFGFVPTDKKILIEYGPTGGITKEETFGIIIHTCFGSRINDTIGRVLSTKLVEKIGSVGLKTDAYRIIVKLSQPVYNKVIDIFYNLNIQEIDRLLESEIKGGELYTHKFVQVAKRFGIIKRDAEYGKAYFKKIIELYSGSPASKETLNEIRTEKLEVQKAKNVLEKIKKGELSIEMMEGISPLGRIGLEFRYEIIPGKSDFEILNIFKERLGETLLAFVCCNCGWNIKVSAKDAYTECHKCKSKMMSVVPKKYIEEASELIKNYKGGKVIPKDEIKWLDKMLTSASLVQNYGKQAFLCLAARGVGPATASKILRKPLNEEDLYKEILEAEKKFIVTKKFWKV